MTQESLDRKKVKGIADIVFLVDITGSMVSCIDALRTNIGMFVDLLTNPGANSSAVISDWRIKICGFRDAKSDDSPWWVERPFTNDLAQVRADLASLEAEGGGDEPESLLDGIWKIASLPSTEKGAAPSPEAWRYRSEAARCVIVFTDASFHPQVSIPEGAGATAADVGRKVDEARIRLSVFAPEADCYQELSRIDKSEIEFIGTLSDARKKMQELTSDPAIFRRTIENLAKTVTATAAAPTQL